MTTVIEGRAASVPGDEPKVSPGRRRREPGPVRRLAGRLRPQRIRLLLAGVLSVLSVALTVAAPLILAKAVDAVFAGAIGAQLPADRSKDQVVTALRASGDDKLADLVQSLALIPGSGIDFTLVGRILLVVLGCYVVSAVAQFVQSWLLNDVVNRTVQRLRDEVEAKVHALPLRRLDGHSRGDVLSRVTNDVDNVAQSLSQTLNQLIVSGLTMIGVIAMMLTVSPSLTLVVLVSIPVVLLTARVVIRRNQRLFVEQWTQTGLLTSQLEEVFTGHDLVTAFGRRQEVRQRFTAVNDELSLVGRRAQFLSNLMQPTTTLVGNLGFVAICVFGAMKVVGGALTLGQVTALLQYSRQFTQPLSQLASMTNLLQSGVASAERVFELLDTPAQSPDRSGTLPMPARGGIEFSSVTFGYDEKPLMQGLDLVVKPGQTVAIVGPSGAGKTTVVNLLMRFHEVDGGRILLDGVNVCDVPRHELRGRIGMVLQDTWLFEGTVAENIGYGRPDAGRDEIRRAAEATYVDRLVRSLPDGYDTLVEENGENLSAGERQLITLARAFVADPTILVLDEATSAVDTRTELLIQQAMTALRRDRTSFVIAHRLSTIRDADMIVVMQSGRIVEQGTHADLLGYPDGVYRELYRTQWAEASR